MMVRVGIRIGDGVITRSVVLAGTGPICFEKQQFWRCFEVRRGLARTLVPRGNLSRVRYLVKKMHENEDTQLVSNGKNEVNSKEQVDAYAGNDEKRRRLRLFCMHRPGSIAQAEEYRALTSKV